MIKKVAAGSAGDKEEDAKKVKNMYGILFSWSLCFLLWLSSQSFGLFAALYGLFTYNFISNSFRVVFIVQEQCVLAYLSSNQLFIYTSRRHTNNKNYIVCSNYYPGWNMLLTKLGRSNGMSVLKIEHFKGPIIHSKYLQNKMFRRQTYMYLRNP